MTRRTTGAGEPGEGLETSDVYGEGSQGATEGSGGAAMSDGPKPAAVAAGAGAGALGALALRRASPLINRVLGIQYLDP
jgi:hypothetical protein